MYDSRVGRWFNIDPLAGKYPNLSPYNFVANNPLVFADFDGKDFGVKIDHDNKTIIIVANVYTTSKKAYSEALSTATAWNTQTAKIEGYNVTFQIAIQKPLKVSTEEVIQFYKENSWNGLYKENGKLDKKKLRESKNKIAELKTMDNTISDPIGNLYESNHGMNSQTIEDPSGETTAGVTENGYAISMYTFLYHNTDGTIRVEDHAKNISERKHEFGHLFGLDDKGGPYFANDGIMVYKFKMNDISKKDIELIIQYANDRLSGKIPASKTDSKVTKLSEKGSNDNSPIK